MAWNKETQRWIRMLLTYQHSDVCASGSRGVSPKELKFIEHTELHIVCQGSQFIKQRL